MELFARLENIEFHIKQLKSKCEVLETKNEQLTIENQQLKKKLENNTQELLNFQETNKISNLAHSAGLATDTTEFKNQIEQLIQEIDKCLTLVKK
jgi:regulator of replication initiation timing